jgi:hypothetical protein
MVLLGFLVFRLLDRCDYLVRFRHLWIVEEVRWREGEERDEGRDERRWERVRRRWGGCEEDGSEGAPPSEGLRRCGEREVEERVVCVGECVIVEHLLDLASRVYASSHLLEHLRVPAFIRVALQRHFPIRALYIFQRCSRRV